MAKKGARVIITVRSKGKGEATLSRLTKDIGNTENLVSFLELDLGSLSSVKKFANEFVELNLPLHMLVLNAGIMKSPGSEFVGQEMRYGFSCELQLVSPHMYVILTLCNTHETIYYFSNIRWVRGTYRS